MARPVFNTIRILIGLYPKAPWDARELSEHPDITWGIVNANPQIKWDYELLLTFMSNKLEILGDYPWNASVLAKREKYKDYKPAFRTLSEPYTANPRPEHGSYNDRAHWTALSRSASITFDFISQHADKPWRYATLALNPAIVSRRTDATGVHFVIQSTPPFTVSFYVNGTSVVEHESPLVLGIAKAIIDHVDGDITTARMWIKLSEDATWRDIEQYPDLPWYPRYVADKVPTLAAAQNYKHAFDRSLLSREIVGSQAQICNRLSLKELASNPRLDWRVVARTIQRNGRIPRKVLDDIVATRSNTCEVRGVRARELLADYTRRWRRARVLAATADLLIPDLAAICAEYVVSYDPTQLPALA